MNRFAAIWANGFGMENGITTILACLRLNIPERCTTTDAFCLTRGIRSIAVIANIFIQSIGKFIT
jgi:hypothetical protein